MAVAILVGHLSSAYESVARGGPAARLFFGLERGGRPESDDSRNHTNLQPNESEIAAKIAELDPRLELIAVQAPARESLRLFIDHPDGVGLDLCERVTMQVRDLLGDFALEVSSPGIDRPLAKPEHYARRSEEHTS